MFKSAFALATLAAVTVAAGPSLARERPTGDQQLAKLLEGRVAGESRSCINTFTNRDSRVIDGTAVVYGRGRTIWVNVPANADDLDDRDAMLIRLHGGSQLCRQDIVTTFDTSSGMFTGTVFLREFVPYTRAN